MSRILAFGTFDLFHKGHEFFLEKAAALGDELDVAVARDTHVRILKHREPGRSEGQRLATVARQPSVTRAHFSDEALGSYHIIDTVKPDAIALGYDQDGLAQDLECWMKREKTDIPLIRIPRA